MSYMKIRSVKKKEYIPPKFKSYCLNSRVELMQSSNGETTPVIESGSSIGMVPGDFTTTSSKNVI